MDNFVRFKDSVNLVLPKIDQKVKDYYTNVFKQGIQNIEPLRVRIAATHAGKITRNNGFYLPHKMMKGASSFTDQYPKPVQVHHQDHQDPIGRIINAKYVDISNITKNTFSDSSSDQYVNLLDSFINGKMSFKDMITFANEWFINDLKVSTNPDYEGLGYIEIVASITDQDAIQKILDGRYLTGSVGARTNQAVCSVCKQDWASSEGRCEHKPGKFYDDIKCVIIAGDLSYDEYSFVNAPADRHSRVIEININGIQDFVSMDNDTENFEITLLLDKQKVNQKTLSITDKENQNLKTDDNRNLNEEFEKIVGDKYDTYVGDDPWGTEYANMIFEAIKSGDQEIADKKLTADDRKKLAQSVFCGPDRSFPIPDCSHARVGMAYAKKYNKSSSIIACIRRKAKRLGCPFKDENSKKRKDMEFTPELFDRLSEEEVIKLFDTVQKVLKERKIESGCEKPKTEESAKEEKKEDSVKLQEEKSELVSHMDAMRKEIRYLHIDIEGLTNSMAEKVAEIRNTKIRHIVDIYKFTGEEKKFDDLSDQMKEKSSEELDKIIEDLAGKVDTKKIADTLNSGLSNNPTGTVENPTLVQDNMDKKKDEKEIASYIKNQLKTDWLRVRMSQGQKVADEWLSAKCKSLEINPNMIVPADKQS